MNPNVIQFACGHCQSWLTVPAHMAGVAGPCPKCGNHIVSPAAPQSAQPSFEPPAPMPVMPQVQPPQWPGAGLQPQAQPVYGGQLPGHQGMIPQPVQNVPGGHEIFPPAPAAAPMVPPPANPMGWGKPPTGGLPSQDPGLPGGYPMQGHGLPPSGGGYGQALPPPQAPMNPIASLMGQMPQQPGFMPEVGNTGVLTRPASVGGSRLSLLARQLTTPPDGSGGLPVAPAPLSKDELPGQRHAVHAAPDGSRNQQVGNMMLKDNMRRGLRVSHTRSRSNAKFALAALLLLVLIGALGWTYRGPLKDIYVQVFPPSPALPEPAAPRPSGPVPGVDKKVKTTPPVAKADPKVGPSSTPPPSTTQVEVVRGTPPPTPPKAPEVKTARAELAPAEEGATEVKPMTEREQVAKPAPLPQTSPSPTPPSPVSQLKSERDLMATLNAPKATLAEEPSDGSPPVPPAPAPTQNPLLENKQTMVEVGRSSADPRKQADATGASPPAPNSNGLPACKDLPPNCQSAFDGLAHFLSARKWQDRLKYVQLPDQMEAKMQLYYAKSGDGPIDVDSIQYLRHDENPQVGKGMHVVFVLFSRNWDYAVPVMVEVAEDGARVDWLTFIEFKDDMLNKFLGTYMEERVQFHVGIHRTHYFDDSIPNLSQKEQFSISSPMGNLNSYVFVPKGTPFARRVANIISWDKEDSFVVAELQWRKEGNAKWVEMTNIPQLNWYNAGALQAKEAGAADEKGAAIPAAIPANKQ